MRRLAPLLLIAPVSITGGAAGASTPPSSPGPAVEAEGCDDSTIAALSSWAAAGFSGSVAISTAGDIDCAAGVGLADRATRRGNTPGTVFALGSVSKAFTAAAIASLAEDGLLELSEPVGSILPELTGPVADVTIAQLMLHTSGLAGSHGEDHAPLDRDDALAAIDALPLEFAPGSEYLYSNAGYTLLALVAEAAGGQPYRDLLVDQVLTSGDEGRVAGGFWDGEPAAAGPRAVGYVDGGAPTAQMGDFAGPHWALTGNGDVAMTMPELAAWAGELFGGSVVGPPALDIIVEPGFDHGGGNAETAGWVLIAADRFGETMYGASGGGGDVGHDVVIAWLPASERAVAIASNGGDVSAEELLQALGPALVSGDEIPLPRPVGELDAAITAATAGTYRLETGGSLSVEPAPRGLVVAAIGSDAVSALFPLPDDVADADVAEHERAVLDLLHGEAGVDSQERADLEDTFGPITAVELAGSAVIDGELRTFAVVSATTDTLVWYSLDDAGGVGAALAPAEPPSRLLVPDTSGGFRPDDPLGLEPPLTVAFTPDAMTLSAEGGVMTAIRPA